MKKHIAGLAAALAVLICTAGYLHTVDQQVLATGAGVSSSESGALAQETDKTNDKTQAAAGSSSAASSSKTDAAASSSAAATDKTQAAAGSSSAASSSKTDAASSSSAAATDKTQAAAGDSSAASSSAAATDKTQAAAGSSANSDKTSGTSSSLASGTSIATGTRVKFSGGKVYSNSSAKTPRATKEAAECTVTLAAPGAAHPYHCVSDDHSVYGWVDADTVAAMGGSTSAASTTLKEGTKVTFKGGPVYVSSKASASSATREESVCTLTIVKEGAAHPYHCISTDGKRVYGWVDATDVVPVA